MKIVFWLAIALVVYGLWLWLRPKTAKQWTGFVISLIGLAILGLITQALRARANPTAPQPGENYDEWYRRQNPDWYVQAHEEHRQDVADFARHGTRMM